MSSVYTIQAAGFRTIYSDSSSNFASNTGSKIRPQMFAGPVSTGLVNTSSNIAFPSSIQFGTGATDGVVDTSFTATPPNTSTSGMESGGSSTAPCLIEEDSAGNQQLGYSRFYWKASDKSLRIVQFPDDALVSLNPRSQLYSHRLIHRNQYRFLLEFQLGDDEIPWPMLVANKNTILIFQIKGASSYPVFDVQIREAASSNPNTRDLYFLRRLANSNSGGFDNQGQDRVAVVSDVLLGKRYNFAVDYFPDYVNQASGGRASIQIWSDNELLTLHSDVGGTSESTGATLYAATPDYIQAMWGLYRVNYATKAPNAACIVFYQAGILTSSSSIPNVNAPLVRT